MSRIAAKLGDRVVGFDIHIVMIPSPGGPVPTPVPMPFNGKLVDGLSTSVCIDNAPAAVEGSGALNNPPHVPAGGPFQNPPSNRATVCGGSSSVYIESRRAAGALHPADTCTEVPKPANGVVMPIPNGSVAIGE
jgi:hypothetical protein